MTFIAKSVFRSELLSRLCGYDGGGIEERIGRILFDLQLLDCSLF